MITRRDTLKILGAAVATPSVMLLPQSTSLKPVEGQLEEKWCDRFLGARFIKYKVIPLDGGRWREDCEVEWDRWLRPEEWSLVIREFEKRGWELEIHSHRSTYDDGDIFEEKMLFSRSCGSVLPL